MARQEFRKPIQGILEEKSKLEKLMTDVGSKQGAMQERMQKLQRSITEHRMAIEALPNGGSSKLAKQVFDKEIANSRRELEEVQTDYEEAEKERLVIDSKIRGLTASWKELEKA